MSEKGPGVEAQKAEEKADGEAGSGVAIELGPLSDPPPSEESKAVEAPTADEAKTDSSGAALGLNLEQKGVESKQKSMDETAFSLTLPHDASLYGTVFSPDNSLFGTGTYGGNCVNMGLLHSNSAPRSKQTERTRAKHKNKSVFASFHHGNNNVYELCVIKLVGFA